ncbi:discoidin domain-containing protein [Kitasatospora sp. NPDC058170]|uniref:galactose-binding domain-containing protein n=1 Tax=Kitasatospora sp. NPDC058170 TaxID=3346364 RepID=UPI0036D776E3
MSAPTPLRRPPLRRPPLRALATTLLTLVALLPVHATTASAAAVPAPAATLAPAPAPIAAVNPSPAVTPTLREWTGGTGSLTLTPASRIVLDPAAAALSTSGATGERLSDRPLAAVADRLATDLAATTGLNLPVVRTSSPADGDLVLALAADPALGTEGYRLDTSGTRLLLTAPTSTGAFYGTRTLLQLLRLDPGHSAVPRGTARDWPQLAYRAEHFDVSRRYMSPTDLKDEIRRASWSKINTVQLMFNQANAFRLYSPAYAALAPTDPAYRYSREDIADIEAVAAEYHVVLVPEIQGPTKAQPYAAFGGTDRSLAAQCNDPSTLDFTDARVTAWTQGLLGEFLDWFHGPYIHLGNDEVPAALADCAYVKGRLTPDAPTVADLQERFIAAEQATVEAHGKRAMIWVNSTAIRPATGVLVMNFGSTAVSSAMRSYGYDVVDSAYGTGAYSRFYISPADYEGKVVPRGDIYAWTPSADPHNLGQVLAAWGDDLFFSETGYYLDQFDGRRAELGERTWNPAATTRGFAAFTQGLAAIGDEPTAAPRTDPPPTTDGNPVHTWTFDGATAPTSATHYPGGWKLTLPDSTGTLHGNGWLYPPTYPAAGHDGNGLGFTAGSGQTLSLGGRPIRTAWTLSLWIRRTADATDTVLLRDQDTAIKVEQAGSDHRFGLSEYGGANHTFDYRLPLGQWTHLTLVSQPGSGTTLYANGVPAAGLPQTIPLPLGGFGGKRPFGGAIDQVAVHRQALAPAAVAALYTRAAGGANLALGRPASASSTYRAGVEPANAVDGSAATRWSSDRTDPQWLQVDLGAPTAVGRVRVEWEAAYGRAYQIQVSDDATTWTTVRAVANGDGGVDDLTGLDAHGRYVRLLGTARGTQYGYSVWEFQVFA